jgi:hypothetical protein
VQGPLHPIPDAIPVTDRHEATHVLDQACTAIMTNLVMCSEAASKLGALGMTVTIADATRRLQAVAAEAHKAFESCSR